MNTKPAGVHRWYTHPPPCTQAGEIREYRDSETGKIIAVAHVIRKGRVWRGQWFYATDAAAQQYVWFHR